MAIQPEDADQLTDKTANDLQNVVDFWQQEKFFSQLKQNLFFWAHVPHCIWLHVCSSS